MPREWPDGTFDLVVLSETGYYFSPEELTELLARIQASTTPGGTLLLCHWRHPISGWELDADVGSCHGPHPPRLAHPRALSGEDFMLEVFLPRTRAMHGSRKH